MPETSHSSDADKASGSKAAAKRTPAVGDLVTYSHTHWNGNPHTQTGLVVGVDADTGKAAVNWLPDAVAAVPFDDLDPVS